MKKECKVGAAIEWSAGSHVANWVQRRGGFLQVGFGHYTLRFSIFPYFFPFFFPKVDLSLFLFCLPKESTFTWNLRFTTLVQDLQGWTSLKFRLCHIFRNHPEQTDPIFLNWLKLKPILTFITWVRYKIGTYQWSRITSGFKIDEISKSPKKLGIKASRFERISTSKVFGKTGFKVALLIGFKVFLTCNLIVGQYQPSSEKGFSAWI